MLRSAPESDARVDVDPGDDRAAPREGFAAKSMGSLFRQLRDDAMTLVRKEVELAKIEVKRDLTSSAKDMILLGVAAVVAYMGGLFLLATVAMAIYIGFVALGLPIAGLALAPLIVTLGLFATAGLLAYIGYDRLKKRDMVPRQTQATLQEDKQWLQSKVR